MIGFDQRHTKAHIYRAWMEAIAMRMKNNFDAMVSELGIASSRLIVCGGGSNSELFMQIIADVFGMTAIRNRINGAAALGAAMCVAVATGRYKGFDQAIRAMVHTKDVFVCNKERHATYTCINEGIYKNLTGMLENTLQTMHNTYKEVEEGSTAATQKTYQS